MEAVSATLIVLVLIGLAGYFGWQQRQSLRWLRRQRDLPAEDQKYYRRQAWLRLVTCGLMVLLAALLAAYYLFGLEARVNQLVDLGPGQALENLNPEQRQVRWLFGAFCLSVLLLLMTIVFLVALDVWAIRRYGRRHMQKIDADRKAMVQDQLARYRTERNGHG